MKKISLFYVALSLIMIVTSRGAAAEGPTRLRVITANVGNIDIVNCGQKYYNKLCLKLEKKIAEG